MNNRLVRRQVVDAEVVEVGGMLLQQVVDARLIFRLLNQLRLRFLKTEKKTHASEQQEADRQGKQGVGVGAET